MLQSYSLEELHTLELSTPRRRKLDPIVGPFWS